MRVSRKRLYIIALAIYIVSLPLGAINIGALGSALKLLAIMPIIIAIFGSDIIRLRKPILMQMIFTLFAGVSIIWSISDIDSIDRVFSYALLFALLLSGCFFTYTEHEIMKIKSAFVWASRFTALVVLLFGGYTANRLFLDGFIQEDPNYLCAYFSFGIIAALQRITTEPRIPAKVWSIVELAFYLYLVLSTGSRGGLIAILAGVTVYLVTFGEKTFRKVILKLVSIAVFCLLLILLMDFLPEELQLRFTVESVAERGGSGRVKIWTNCLDLFSNSSFWRQLFGYGTATIVSCFTKFGYGIRHVAHNMFFETLVELGIVGLIIYTLAIFTFVKAAYRDTDKFSFAVIGCMVVLSLSTSIYTFKPYFNVMLYIILCQNVIRNEVHADIA